MNDPKNIVREVILARLDGRRGFKPGDAVPFRQFWPSINAALGAMASNEVAFKAYEYADGTAGLSILADYVVISRAKKSAPWKDAGTRILASCQWDADEQVAPTPLRKAVTPETWIDLQTRQHLRAVGIKLTR